MTPEEQWANAVEIPLQNSGSDAERNVTLKLHARVHDGEIGLGLSPRADARSFTKFELPREKTASLSRSLSREGPRSRRSCFATCLPMAGGRPILKFSAMRPLEWPGRPYWVVSRIVLQSLQAR